jgi:hypothetical protein
MLWSVPRSRSTAFFRMMAERGDFTVTARYLAAHLPYYEALYDRRLTPA